MKVLLVNGSAHEHGCTDAALQEVAHALNREGVETEIWWMGNKPVNGCIACRACGRTGYCAFGKEDGVNELIDRLDAADGVILGSPVHYAGPAGNFHSLLDRVFYAHHTYAGKPGAAVLSCRRSGGTASFDVLNKYFTISGMPVVSSQYWNVVHGNTPQEVRQDLEGMQIMRTLGRNMAWLLRCIEAGKAAGCSYPASSEKREMTNFIR